MPSKSELPILARDIGIAERTLRRAVRRGTVRCYRPGPRRFEVEAAEKEYLRKRWDVLAALTEALRTERNVRLAVLFGSVARGTERPDSDVDVLIETEGSWSQVAALQLKLTLAVGREVNVVRLADALRDAPELVMDALGEGRVLIDRGGRLRELRAQRSVLERAARRLRSRQQREATEALAALAGAPDG